MESNPLGTVQQLANGHCVPRCLHVVANLGVADVLDDTPRTAADLAATVGVHPDALHRVLRLLASYGVFEMQGDTFRHSPASRVLRTDHPQPMRAFVRMCGLPLNWNLWEALESSVRSGVPAVTSVLPDGLWTYYSQHPSEGQIFNAAMEAKAHGQVAGIIAAYDFSRFALIGDIGGGHGHLLRAILAAAPTATGILFDLPTVIEEVAEVASERVTLQAGDFFRDALPRCDAYLLIEVIHDWGDDEAVAILRAIRRAAPSHTTLLLMEGIMSEEPRPDWATMLDISMLLIGGRQRTLPEYAALLDTAGFALQRDIDTHAGISILEARTA